MDFIQNLPIFENITFLGQSSFYFIYFIPVFIFLIYRTRKYWIKFKHSKELKSVFWTGNFFIIIKSFILTLIFVLFTLLLANPNKSVKHTEIIENWIDIEIVLDISYSTLARDILPNRIEAAKKVIEDFSYNIESDRLWLIVFARKAFNLVPLTTDYKTFRELTSEISVTTINQENWLAGTNIWDSLLLAYNSFNNPDRKKVVILISDWVHNVPEATNPLDSAKFLADEWVKIYTIWIWWDKRAFVYEIATEVDPVDEDWLISIAKIWGWKYFRAKDEWTLKDIFNELLKLEKTEIKKDVSKVYKPYYLPFILLLISMMCLFISIELIYNYKD